MWCHERGVLPLRLMALRKCALRVRESRPTVTRAIAYEYDENSNLTKITDTTARCCERSATCWSAARRRQLARVAGPFDGAAACPRRPA